MEDLNGLFDVNGLPAFGFDDLNVEDPLFGLGLSDDTWNSAVLDTLVQRADPLDLELMSLGSNWDSSVTSATSPDSALVDSPPAQIPTLTQLSPIAPLPALVPTQSPRVSTAARSTGALPTTSRMLGSTMAPTLHPSGRNAQRSLPLQTVRDAGARGCPKRKRKTIQRKRQEQLARLEQLTNNQRELKEIVRVASEEVSKARRALYSVLKSAQQGRLELKPNMCGSPDLDMM